MDGEDEADAIKNSFQWLGGDPGDFPCSLLLLARMEMLLVSCVNLTHGCVVTENAESKVTKDKLQQVLRDFELNDDVDKVRFTYPHDFVSPSLRNCGCVCLANEFETHLKRENWWQLQSACVCGCGRGCAYVCLVCIADLRLWLAGSWNGIHLGSVS